MPENNSTILDFRLTAVETKLDESLGLISAKLDALLLAVGQYQLEQALTQERLETMKSRLSRAETELEILKENQTGLRISLAEKIGPGAISGAISAIIIVALRFIVGV